MTITSLKSRNIITLKLYAVVRQILEIAGLNSYGACVDFCTAFEIAVFVFQPVVLVLTCNNSLVTLMIHFSRIV